jgi:hypothetical protein
VRYEQARPKQILSVKADNTRGGGKDGTKLDEVLAKAKTLL